MQTRSPCTQDGAQHNHAHAPELAEVEEGSGAVGLKDGEHKLGHVHAAGEQLGKAHEVLTKPAPLHRAGELDLVHVHHRVHRLI